MCLAVVTNPFFFFLKVLSSPADGDAPQQERFCADRSTKHGTDREQHEEIFERGKAGEEEKSPSLGSDGCWSRAAHDGLGASMVLQFLSVRS